MTNILIGDFLVVFFIFLRIISAIMVAPVLGHNAFPAIAKIFVSFVLAYVTFLTINKTHIEIDVNLVSLAVYAMKEILTGIIMGYMLNFVFYGINYAGALIGLEMGLMFSEVLNPMAEISESSITQPIHYAAIMVFLMINGHHYIISALVASFNLIPIAKFTLTQPVIQLIVKYSFAVFVIAIKIASPILVSFFLIHLAEGIISRVIPNIQVFFITQPAKIAIGFAFLAALTPLYVYVIKILLGNYEEQLQVLIMTMSA